MSSLIEFALVLFLVVGANVIVMNKYSACNRQINHLNNVSEQLYDLMNRRHIKICGVSPEIDGCILTYTIPLDSKDLIRTFKDQVKQLVQFNFPLTISQGSNKYVIDSFASLREAISKLDQQVVTLTVQYPDDIL